MGKARILVVEDESIVALDIARSLESLGFEVAGKAVSGEKAVELAAEYCPDLILMDIKLKGPIDGITAAHRVLAKSKAPIVFLTAHADRHTIERAQAVAPYGYLVKPFTDEELFATVQIALYRHRLDQRKSTVDALSSSSTSGCDSSIRDKNAKSAHAAISSFLKSIPLFSEASDTTLSYLSNAAQVRRISAGRIVYAEGDKDPYPFIVRSGRISVLKSANDGRELLIDILPSGDSFGLLPSLEENVASATTRAQVEAEIILLPKSSLARILENHPQLSFRFAQYLARRLGESYTFAQSMAHDQVRVRLATALCKLPSCFAISGSAENSVLEVSRQELADMIGATVETVVRAMKVLEHENIVRSGRARSVEIIDIGRLRQASQCD